MKQAKYLYCIIKETGPKKFNILGQKEKQEEKDVYTINQGGLAAVVSDSEVKDYFLSREELLLHQRVIEKVMEQGYDVLPISFGVVTKNEEDIKKKLLKPKRKELLEAFKKIEGKVELAIKVLWKDMPGIFQKILTENPEIETAKKDAQKNPNQFKLAAIGELVQKATEAKREREAQNILNPLKKLAVDFKERKLLRSREVMQDSMICNGAFLVAKENEKEFDKKVEALIKEYDKSIKFIYTGPSPPFNFVELHLTV